MGSIAMAPDRMSVTTLDKMSICGKNEKNTLNVHQSLPGVSNPETLLDRLLEQFECVKTALFHGFFLKMSFNLTNFVFTVSKRPKLTI
jgi:hypothetical protein